MTDDRNNFTLVQNSNVLPPRQWGAGRGLYHVQATDFSGQTATLEYSMDGGVTFVAVADDAIKATNGNVVFELPHCLLRVTVSGATTGLLALINRTDLRNV